MLASSILRNTLSPTTVQSHVRTLVVLKRHFPLRLPSADEPHKNLRTTRSRTYEIVERTEVKKPEPLKVVLKELVEGYGAMGDVIEVPRNVGRFHLILPGKAVYASPENIEWGQRLQKSGVPVKRFTSKFSPALIREVRTRVFALIMSEKHAWTLKKWHVRAHLRSQGLIVPEEVIELPDSNIQRDDDVFGKDIIVNIKINGADDARCRMRFRSAEVLFDPATQLLEVERPWYVEPPIALLESQADEINQMHEALMKVFNQKIEDIKNEGLRSVNELNVQTIF